MRAPDDKITKIAPSNWVIWASGISALIGVVVMLAFEIFDSSGGDVSGGTLLCMFVFLPLSFIFSIVSVITTLIQWNGLRSEDRGRGLVPIAFPVLGFLLVLAIAALSP